MKNSKKRWKVIGVVILGLMVLVLGSFYIYTLDYYKALPVAIETLENHEIESEAVDKILIFRPDTGGEKGIIFYPGGKVDYLAYAPLMAQIAQEGYSVFLIKMPFNLAVFNQGAAKQVIEAYEEIDSWYIAGHSLGGAMASLYASKHQDQIDGLILLGAYPAADLSDSNMKMLSIYGSQDLILSKDQAEENKAYAPPNSSYFEIQGGNHAYYGSYGEQKKDGQASMSDREQQEITSQKIAEFMQVN